MRKDKLKSFFDEFKQFAMRGNVIDMAVGIVIGAAFGKIVTSFVNDVLMPPIGFFLGGVNLTGLHLTMGKAMFNYGNFLQTLIDFTIIAFAIFMVIKGMTALRRKEEEKPVAPAEPTKQEKLLEEIRDLLRQKI